MAYGVLDCQEDDTYRYSLTVTTGFVCNRTLAVIQMNPSHANAQRSDSTVGKIVKWAYESEFAKVTFLNLFAFRSPKIEKLKNKAIDVIIGPKNDAVISMHVAAADVIVLAWGKDIPVNKTVYF